MAFLESIVDSTMHLLLPAKTLALTLWSPSHMLQFYEEPSTRVEMVTPLSILLSVLHITHIKEIGVRSEAHRCHF